jgi:hypothetical protein
LRKEQGKMLDYEVYYYEVQWYEDDSFSNLHFETEESAVDFIKKNRDEWTEYKLLRIQTAIIDF